MGCVAFSFQLPNELLADRPCPVNVRLLSLEFPAC